jgi:hypothetical protein
MLPPGGATVTSGKNQLTSGQKSADFRATRYQGYQTDIHRYIALFWHFLTF